MRSVALDLDGTLLNSQKDISKENISILREIYRKGIEVFIVTGRSYSATEGVIKKLGLPITAICYNGAKVVDSKTEKLFMNNLFQRI